MSCGRTIPYTVPTVAPLTENQKQRIVALAEQGKRDREIALELGCGEGQVERYRARMGINMAHNRGNHEPLVRGLRPRHTYGSPPEPEWFKSCDDAFRAAFLAAHPHEGF